MSPTHVVFTNVRVFDGTGRQPFAAEVVVEGDTIRSVVDLGSAPAGHERPPGAQVIDGRGGVLMPGLTDGHAHLALGSTVEMTSRPQDWADEDAALLMAHCGRVMLDHGFTSAYSGGSGSMRGELAVKKAFAAGWLPGPRLVTSSFERLPGGPMGLRVKFPGRHVRPSEPDAMVAFIDEVADVGVDTAKFLLNGVSAFDAGSNMGEQFHPDEIRAAADAAHRRGLWLTAHCYTAAAIRLAIDCGFRVLYHCIYADEAALDAIESHKDRLFIGLAPGIVEADLIRAPKFGIMASDADRAEQADAADRVKALGQALRRRGVRSVPGGDYGFPWNPIGLNARDLELFVEWFGYTPGEALSAATAWGGELMGEPERLGLVRPGYAADLLVVDGDPTADISLLRDPRRLRVIMKDGRLHKHVA